MDEGQAVQLRAGRRYVVAGLWGRFITIPGEDKQHLLLFSESGRLLDELSCSISSRLTMTQWDKFLTEAPKGEWDGAQLALRYIPPRGEGVPGNWCYHVTYGGKSYRYGLSESVHQGLCRVAVRDGKFAVVFPNLEEGLAD